MATAIGKVAAVFTANTSGLTSGVNKAGTSLDRLSKQVAGLQRSTKLLATIQVGQVFASAASSAAGYVRSIAGIGLAQAQVIDRQSKLAQAIGISDASLASLSLAGELAGVGLEQIGNAANKLNVTLGRAIAGEKAAADAFADIGLAASSLARADAPAQFSAIAAAIAKLPTQAEKAAAAVAIFGRTGAELLPLFAGGSKAIDDAAKHAERLGLAISNEQANAVEAMNDALSLAQKAFAGITTQVVSALAPAVKQMADNFISFVEGFKSADGLEIGGKAFANSILDAMLTGASYFLDAVSGFATIADKIVAAIDKIPGVDLRTDQQRRIDELQGQISAQRQRTLFAPLFGEESLQDNIRQLHDLELALKLANEAAGPGLLEGSRQFLDDFRKRIEETRAASREAGKNIAEGLGAAAGGLNMQIDVPAIDASALDAKMMEFAGVVGNSKIYIDQDSAKKAADAFKDQAVLGIDSNSSEGIREMFRLMRGQPEDRVQQEQLACLQDIRANTSAGPAGGLAIATI